MLKRRAECLRPEAKRRTSKKAPRDVTKWGIDSLSEERTQSFVSTERQEPILRMQGKQMTACLLKITEYLPRSGKTVCEPSLTQPWSCEVSRSNRSICRFVVNVFTHIYVNNYLSIVVIYETAGPDKTLHHWVAMISISELRLARKVIIFFVIYLGCDVRDVYWGTWLFYAGTVLGSESKVLYYWEYYCV